MERPLERTLHNSTRAQLSTPYDNRHEDYLPFETRINTLKILTYRERRTVTSIITVVKIMREELRTVLKEVTDEYRHVARRVTRNASIFDFGRNCELPASSPMRIGMANINTYRDAFSMDDSIATIRSKLTAKILTNRSQ